MFILDREQTREYLEKFVSMPLDRLSNAVETRAFVNGQPGVTVVDVTSFANSVLAAKAATSFFGDFLCCVLYVHSLGIRPSLENPHLYDRLRKSYGELRPNFLAPAHMFFSYDEAALLSFCDVVINSRFRAALVQHVSSRSVIFDDEDIILIEPLDKASS